MLDVNSGCVHVVDELAYRVIPIIEELLNQKVEDKAEITAQVASGLGKDVSEVAETVDEILEQKRMRHIDTFVEEHPDSLSLFTELFRKK